MSSPWETTKKRNGVDSGLFYCTHCLGHDFRIHTDVVHEFSLIKHLKAYSYRAKVGAKTIKKNNWKRSKNKRKFSPEKEQTINENFRLHVRFRSVWTHLNGLLTAVVGAVAEVAFPFTLESFPIYTFTLQALTLAKLTWHTDVLQPAEKEQYESENSNSSFVWSMSCTKIDAILVISTKLE